MSAIEYFNNSQNGFKRNGITRHLIIDDFYVDIVSHSYLKNDSVVYEDKYLIIKPVHNSEFIIQKKDKETIAKILKQLD